MDFQICCCITNKRAGEITAYFASVFSAFVTIAEIFYYVHLELICQSLDDEQLDKESEACRDKTFGFLTVMPGFLLLVSSLILIYGAIKADTTILLLYLVVALILGNIYIFVAIEKSMDHEKELMFLTAFTYAVYVVVIVIVFIAYMDMMIKKFRVKQVMLPVASHE